MDLSLPRTNKHLALGFGFGKTILLGEHFVVYGLPALVSALEVATIAEVEPHLDQSFLLLDERITFSAFNPSKQLAYEEMATIIFNKMGVEPHGWRITLRGSLPVVGGGIGASAAAAVAITRALNEFFLRGLTDEEINMVAWCGERAVHSLPSGVDNAAATFGSTFIYQLGPQQFTYERVVVALPSQAHLILADSGRATNIKQVLSAVAAFKSQHVSAMTNFFQRYSALFSRGIQGLRDNDMNGIGCAMTENHGLLQELGISCPELDFMVKQALSAGALGAKLTGTGCGGLMVALSDSAIVQRNIVNTLRNLGFFAMGIATANHAKISDFCREKAVNTGSSSVK